MRDERNELVNMRKAMKRSEPTRIKYHTPRLKDPGIKKEVLLTEIGSRHMEIQGKGWKTTGVHFEKASRKLIDKRRLLKQKKENARSERVIGKYSKEYSECNKQTNRKLSKDKRDSFETKVIEAEEPTKKGQQGEIYTIN